MGHLPWLDYWIRVKNPILRKIAKFPIVQFTVDRIAEHERDPESHNNSDFLTEFMKAREKFPHIMDEDRIAENARTAVGAGSDTTAIALRELVYQLLVNPRCYGETLPSLLRTPSPDAIKEKFMAELKGVLAARPQDQSFDTPIKWAEGNKMKYFQACVKECLRYHSPLGQILPREVPKGGITLCGQFIPEGTVVGCNAWVVHRDKVVYGANAHEFYPERWIESTPEHIQRMENLNFAFGGGPRVCIGKNIALLEIAKFIPEFFRCFEVELVDASRYKSHAGWLVPQSGLDVILKTRNPMSLVM